MNNRIRELAEQAGYHPDVYELCKPGMEKFAELIIQECLKVCKKTEQYEVGNQDPDEVGCIRAGAAFCRDDIKEHFGVEGR